MDIKEYIILKDIKQCRYLRVRLPLGHSKQVINKQIDSYKKSVDKCKCVFLYISLTKIYNIQEILF